MSTTTSQARENNGRIEVSVLLFNSRFLRHFDRFFVEQSFYSKKKGRYVSSQMLQMEDLSNWRVHSFPVKGGNRDHDEAKQRLEDKLADQENVLKDKEAELQQSIDELDRMQSQRQVRECEREEAETRLRDHVAEKKSLVGMRERLRNLEAMLEGKPDKSELQRSRAKEIAKLTRDIARRKTFAEQGVEATVALELIEIRIKQLEV